MASYIEVPPEAFTCRSACSSKAKRRVKSRSSVVRQSKVYSAAVSAGLPSLTSALRNFAAESNS